MLKQHPEVLMIRPEAKLLWKLWCSEAIELLGSEVVRKRCCLEAIALLGSEVVRKQGCSEAIVVLRKQS